MDSMQVLPFSYVHRQIPHFEWSPQNCASITCVHCVRMHVLARVQSTVKLFLWSLRTAPEWNASLGPFMWTAPSFANSHWWDTHPSRGGQPIMTACIVCVCVCMCVCACTSQSITFPATFTSTGSPFLNSHWKAFNKCIFILHTIHTCITESVASFIHLHKACLISLLRCMFQKLLRP